jgi:tetratricopeptide (TPR) repeat protein
VKRKFPPARRPDSEYHNESRQQFLVKDSAMTHQMPTLSELLSRYLQKQADACAVGAAAVADEVTPYEAGPVQPIDSKLAWDEALAVFALSEPVTATSSWKAPPAWSSLVAGHEPVVALALAAGNFPQLVRNFHLILQATDLTSFKPHPGRAAAGPELTAWADGAAERRQIPQMLLAVGVLRLAKQLETANDYVRKHDAAIPPAWRAAWENEKAALAWHGGRPEEALTAWQRLEPTPAVSFNRGMAALFLGDAAGARAQLSAAVARLPETIAWHHLGRLYLTLAR